MKSEMRAPLITLLTDFGLRDHFVGVMKGVILDICPEAQIVDISHDIPAHDLLSAYFVLRSSYHFFPSGSIHVCIVDPGVGSPRKPIIVSTDRYLFVGPDNGLFTAVYEQEESCRTLEISADHYFRKPLSKTFHGRDIFAPVAGWLARGIEVEKFGEALGQPLRLQIPGIQRSGEREFSGLVLYVDRFGNLISNFPNDRVEMVRNQVRRPLVFSVGQQRISQFCDCYADGGEDQLFAVPGSSGYVEFALRRASAAATTGLRPGARVQLTFEP